MKQLVVIAGPTASGKTQLAIELAQLLDAEIINADSRQFYKGLDIGTAKPTIEEQAQVKHHFLDIKKPNEPYSAGDFERDVLAFLEEYYQNHDIAILVGGSGLYLKAVIEGFDDLPRDENIRENWNEQFTKHGIRCLQERIIELDSVFAKIAELDNPQRLIRAIEVCETTGAKLSDLRIGNSKNRDFQCQNFYLNPERAILYERINQRVDTMLNTGLLDEVKSHVSYKGSNALKTVGYSELFSFLDGEYSFEYAVAKIKQHTRNYAKRQVTWFKKQDGFIPVADNAVSFIQKHLNA